MPTIRTERFIAGYWRVYRELSRNLRKRGNALIAALAGTLELPGTRRQQRAVHQLVNI
jgi:hypothetical protein